MMKLMQLVILYLFLGEGAFATAPLGINLNGIAYWSPEQPFLNIFKTGGWITHSPTQWDTGEETYLQLDLDGYPTTLTASASDPNSPQLFTYLGVLVQREFSDNSAGFPQYPAGQYVFLYDGEGTINIRIDATIVSTAPGRIVVNVATPSTGGIWIQIFATDPNHTGNYLRNMRFVKAEYESALAAGQVFNPALLDLLQGFKVLRFKDWLKTDGSVLSSWSNRPLQTDAFWSYPTGDGTPVEVAIQLANTVVADAWVNVPVAADDDYIVQMAALVHTQLGFSQKVYVELSNEVWNGIYPQYKYAANQGQVLWPTQSGATTATWNRNWYGMRTAQMCDLWKAAWGADSGRVVCVLGAQASSTWTATQSLNCVYWTAGAPCSNHGIDAVAISAYFGGKTPATWTSDPDGGLTSLFASLYSQNDPSIPVGGFLAQVSGWELSFVSAMAPYGLPVIGYEGGQIFVSFPNGTAAQTNLYIAVNRDARMGTAYTDYLTQWGANVGNLMMLFGDVYRPSQYGEWGLLESVMQPPSASPKWQAVQNFMVSLPPPPPPVCAFRVSPTSVSMPVGNTSANVSVVATDPSCTWTSVSNVTWIKIGAASSGSGSGTVAYTVTKNPGGPKKPRTGMMVVAGQTVTVTQQ